MQQTATYETNNCCH